jgi:hemerythrin superfamily protein
MIFKSHTAALLDMLKEDHQKVKDLFEEFERSEDRREKQRLAETIVMELTIHADLEEDLIYPEIRQALDDEEAQDLMDEALEEHHVVHLLVNELKKMKPSDDRFDAKMSVLAESVRHHIKEEEDEMFPKAETAEVEWEDLEARVMKRKEQLTARLSGGSGNRSGGNKKRSGGRKMRRAS